MVQIGYTMMTEQAGPRALVDDLVAAERAGFDFSVTSDHYFPWLEEQGHSPYAWSVLGAAAQATSRIPLMTYVTCPTVRYHPAVVAQKAATMQLLSEGRFRLGLGSGENLNEHIVGAGWPSARVRIEMLEEAVEIIRALFTGDNVNHEGTHFDVANAKLWDVPDELPPIGIAVSGERSCKLAGRHADLVIATEPKAELIESFDKHGGRGKPRVGQLPVCYDTDKDAAIARAHDQFRWSVGGWPVNSELPGPSGFSGATQFVTKEDMAEQIPCGDNVDDFVEAVRPFAEAGFTEIALVQVGGDQQRPFIDWAEKKLLPALREL
ncbi:MULTISPECIES: LLM class F420-dependent oxidoreductase [Streptomyces]|uniref:LLM class F420-dependent oxidoreductase n=1 Tax=Streptomyces venezuelae TaxID=54571 RepID=A0A5P2BK25_STRVZ|nr:MULTISPECIES: LLM class F420-dependent oxidoreductase [Streptomyces]NEA04740.1 LLM class F420-dependent oxidoreductase [Streptomyces sp. SID10116]MYY80688.1 TIGR03557 family F420-dependent LLM class oxidoreductase [Streptomyces sp. SID335]MYZ11886.1 TIGR03557 family F420-dependent LLM class oxidoreductase [Streptomyces sp. SID337]MYZ13797.1 TIGR03557 family F420-dependent LLM class oxidoreductase [Streptomyces sp. SID337]NDZ89206.1 LLM class F420-dependent oxidoreductase [Streptomyces sp. S